MFEIDNTPDNVGFYEGDLILCIDACYPGKIVSLETGRSYTFVKYGCAYSEEKKKLIRCLKVEEIPGYFWGVERFVKCSI
jgi:hypothetical protein